MSNTSSCHNNSTVSVITPTFKNIDYLEETLQSVRAQTYQDYEHIVIDDGSSTECQRTLNELVSRFPQVKLLLLEQNQGAGIARNIGIENATGRYIAFLDSDDTWLPDKLKKQLEHMSQNEIDLCYSSYNVIDDQGEHLYVRRCSPVLTYFDLLKCNQIGCSTAIIDTKYTGKRFMPDLRKRQDMALWLDLLKRGAKAGGLTEPTTNYRASSPNQSLSSNKLGVLKYQWKIYREVESISLIRSFFYFLCYMLNGIRNYYLRR